MNQEREQAGFRKNFSTVDNIFAPNQIIEKTIEYKVKIKLMFIDSKKAFAHQSTLFYLFILKIAFGNTRVVSKKFWKF